MRIFLTAILLVCAVIYLSNCKTTGSRDPMDAGRGIESAKVMESIKGKEQLEVTEVFSNLKVLNGFPAENLVTAMETWSKALGVTCSYCHNSLDYAADSKPEKEVSRDMVRLAEKINADLAVMPNLGSEKPIVNCVTCHRGATKPALRMR